MQTTYRRYWRVLAEVALVLVVAVVALSVFLRVPADQAGDEANKVGTAYFYDLLFVQHDLSAEAWPDDHWTRTQPMVARYIIGAWLSANGFDYQRLDPYYDHRRKWTSNVEEGKAPDRAMLTSARVPMRVLTAVSALLVYGIVRVLAGPVGGAAAALLFCGSSYLALHMVRAMSEPPFITFLLAALLICLVAIKRAGTGTPAVGWGVLAGMLLGLAFASKLTAVIAMIGMVAWGVWATFGKAFGKAVELRLPLPAHWRAAISPPDQPETKWRAPGRRLLPGRLAWAIGVVAVSFLMFVATNPFLYRDPVGRTLLLFQNRQQEMAEQAAADSSRAVTSLRDRVRLVWRGSLLEDTWGDNRLRFPFESVLAVVGFVWLAARALRPTPGPEALLLLWVVGFYSGVTLGLGYVLDHYFVPTATLGILLNGLAIGWGAQAAWLAVRRLVVRRRQAPTATPRGAVVA